MLEHNVSAAFERHAQFRREVEDARRARLHNPSHAPKWHCRLLDGFGRWMIDWGWRLRTRYGIAEPSA